MHFDRAVVAFVLLTGLSFTLQAATHDLSDGAHVRIQSSQLDAGWHEGKTQITKEGCALVWTPNSKMPGGRMGLGLMFVQKLERQDGAKWIEMPVEPMVKKEPKACQEGAG